MVGELEQVPPQFAAVKVRGTPAYKMARAGTVVALEARRIQVHALALLSFREAAAKRGGPPTVQVELLVHCSKGTYIRSIARDLGRHLGCGGHLAGLRRLASGGVTVDRCHGLQQLEAIARQAGRAGLESLLEPLDFAVQHLPAVVVNAQLAQRLRNGGDIPAPPGAWPRDGFVDWDLARAYGTDGRLIALLAPSANRTASSWWRPSLVFAA